MDDESLQRLAKWIERAKSFVAFTGAGISTESGIPDFRSPGGIWSQSQPVYYNDFLRSPEARYEYWRQKAASHDGFMQARPNVAHESLAEWESSGRLRGVITQNIDGLHQIAGSRDVLELHGTAREIACLSCAERFDADEMVQAFRTTDVVPRCPSCAGLLKHATVSFGQPLPREVLQEAIRWAEQADLFLVIGSSLVVEPAASLPGMAGRNAALVVIVNRDETPADPSADLILREPIGEVFTALRERLG